MMVWASGFVESAEGAEELVAELGAAFWCAQFGLEQATRHDHASYLGDSPCCVPHSSARGGARTRSAGIRLPDAAPDLAPNIDRRPGRTVRPQLVPEGEPLPAPQAATPNLTSWSSTLTRRRPGRG